MADEPTYHLDKRELRDRGEGEPPSPSAVARPWIGVTFECCNAYTRIYRNREGTAYEGRCPRCLRVLHVRIGPEGTNDRFFSAQ